VVIERDKLRHSLSGKRQEKSLENQWFGLKTLFYMPGKIGTQLKPVIVDL
jgi:hypothetical protein